MAATDIGAQIAAVIDAKFQESLTTAVQCFSYSDAPKDQQAVLHLYYQTAMRLVESKRDHHTLIALTLLLQSRDAAIRAMTPPIAPVNMLSVR